MTVEHQRPALAETNRPYGYRARIGSISPAAVNEIKPYEFYQAAPDGTTLVLTELSVREVTQDQVDEALDKVVDAAGDLGRMGVDFIVIAGTPLVVMKPPEFEAHITAQVVSAAPGVPVATSQKMEVAALRHLGLERIVIATPWSAKVNDPLRAYMERVGFEVLAIEGAQVPLSERGRTSPETALDLGSSLLERHPSADGLYIACPNWPTLPAIPVLERRFDKPVLNGIAAFIWYPLTHLGKFEPVGGRGRLLEGWNPSRA